MVVKEIGDPRLQALFGTTDPRKPGVRPTVRLPSKGLPTAALAVMALVFGVMLFMLLESRRTYAVEPPIAAQPSDNGAAAWAPPPPLYVPPDVQPRVQSSEQPRPAVPPVAAPAAQPAPLPHLAPPVAPMVQPAPQVLVAPPLPPQPQHVSSGSPLVIDSGSGSASLTAAGGAKSLDGVASVPRVTRMQASAFANRSMTVPQGYLIPAVLETGLDSTKPGYARAIVSRDVHGFDGKYVLIPRGSRLIGESKSAAGQGQKRAVISWTRLIRPDGMTIAMDAPAVDPVGGGGIPAKVNNHFFAKLGDALLQSTFAIGQALAGRAVTGPVVVVANNSSETLSQVAVPGTNYVPTLKVAPGKSISVFVAQDLDFTSAGANR